MIRVNLLDSVTDKVSSVSIIETRVTNPRTQTLLLLACVGVLTVTAMGFDYLTATSARREAQAELASQQQVALQMAAVKGEMDDLEKKTAATQSRVDAIKKLRSSQQGPVAVLSAINERLPAQSDFRLKAIEQKGGDLTISGDSRNEAAVTQFGRSLEFSSGLFSNVSIETKREALPAATGAMAAPATANVADALPPPAETVTFTVKCKYTVPGSGVASVDAAAPKPATQLAQK